MASAEVGQMALSAGEVALMTGPEFTEHGLPPAQARERLASLLSMTQDPRQLRSLRRMLD